MASSAAWPQQTGSWIDVPFVSEQRDGCGAASILMVMKYWQEQLGKPPAKVPELVDLERLLVSPQAHGIYASDLERYFDEHGFETHVFRGDQGLAEHHLRQGRPLIVALKPTRGPILHYVVVAGIDREEKVWFLNDPARRKLVKVDSRRFENQWQAAGSWTLLAIPRLDTR